MRASPLEPERSWPGAPAASRTSTSQPRRVRAHAADRPRSPAPTTTQRRWVGHGLDHTERGRAGPRRQRGPAVRSAAVTSGMEVSTHPARRHHPGRVGPERCCAAAARNGGRCVPPPTASAVADRRPAYCRLPPRGPRLLHCSRRRPVVARLVGPPVLGAHLRMRRSGDRRSGSWPGRPGPSPICTASSSRVP